MIGMDAYQHIKNGILEGIHAPGQRLTEDFLAAELNLSRTPIREALRRLEAEGLVTTSGRGVSVRAFSTQDVRQIYELRALLEGYAAEHAAVWRDKNDLVQFQLANERFASAVSAARTQTPDIREFVEANRLFHEGVLAACKNQHIYFLISKVVVLPLVFRSFYWYDGDAFQISLEYHETIFRAILHHEPERARSAMVEHIYRGRDHVVRHIGEDQSSESDFVIDHP